MTKKGYMDTSLTARERAALLLREMSLDEKMGQISCYFNLPIGGEMEDACPDGPGEISTLGTGAMTHLGDYAQWQIKMQKRAMELSEHHIPAIFHMEGLCGGFVQDATSFPCGIGRGASWDPAIEKKIGRTVARQEKALGITHILAPVLDINRDSRMGRQGETYGEDPTLAAVMGSAYVSGIQEESETRLKAEAVAKHFIGFHDSKGAIHGANVEMSDRQLSEIYGKPFQAAITKSKLRGIMPCYCSVNGEPMSLSRKYLNDMLRDEMGFDGCIISDYGAVANAFQIQKIGESIADVGLRCLRAGVDNEMPMRVCFGDGLKQMFLEGKADISILDRAVGHILEAKFRMGLFEHPYALEGEKLQKEFYHAGDYELTKKAAEESLVLIKNQGEVLPISNEIKKIAVIGCHADNARFMFGGYTYYAISETPYVGANAMAGTDTSGNEDYSDSCYPGSNVQMDSCVPPELFKRISPKAGSIVEELRKLLPNTEIVYAYGYPYAGNDESKHEEALKVAEDAELVLLTLGGRYGANSIATTGEGIDGTNINLPLCQESFIRKASKLRKPLVGIHFDGRPISSNMADKYLDAILEAWAPAESGGIAIAEALIGKTNPGGKLPVTVAYHSGQAPIYYNHPNGSAWHVQDSVGFANYVDLPHTPRYYFGHGLSYTTFEYTDLKLSEKEISPDKDIDVSVIVKNTGKRAGDEVVQLYLTDCQASMTRPCQELQGFSRIHLDPGESKKVVFKVRASQMAFLDQNMNWKVEKGKIDVAVGSSSFDIRQTDNFLITEDLLMDGRERGFFAEVTVF